jgi:ABC-type glycerol-3-phosphate transport system substrate-binding protein
MGKARVITALLVGATLAIAATGCSAQAGKPASTGTTGGGTLTYWSMWKQGEAQQNVVAKAIADFEKKTGTTVKVQWQGRTNVQKLVPALNTNNVPDLVDGSFAKLAPVLAKTDQALALSGAYATTIDGKTVSELIPKKYIKNADIYTKADKPWMLPYSLTTDAIWFDASTHPKLKKSPPKTWDDFIAELDTLKKSGEAPLAADGDVAGYNVYWFNTLMMRSQGPGSLLKLASDKTGNGWDSPKVLDAAKKVSELVKGDYFVKGYDSSKWPAQQQVWATNGAALLFNGSWIPTETGPYASPDFVFDSFRFPQLTGGVDSQRADFVGFAVPAKAKNAKNAQALAAFLLGKKYQDSFGTDAKIIPIRADAAVSPEMKTEKAALDNATKFYQQNDGIAFPGYNEKVFWPISDKLFLGKSSPQEFVTEMKAAQIDYWKNNG